MGKWLAGRMNFKRHNSLVAGSSQAVEASGIIGSTGATDTPFRTGLDLIAVGGGHKVPGSTGQVVVVGDHTGLGWDRIHSSGHHQVGVAYPAVSNQQRSWLILDQY